jgi:Protein of unknown function (DUF3106)
MRAKEQKNTTGYGGRTLRWATSVLCALAAGFIPSVAVAGQHSAPPPPHVNAPHSMPPSRPQPQMGPMSSPNRNGQQHLSEWLNHHQNLTPAQREDALRHEPGFNRLPEERQQRYINQMHSLNSLPPQERQRTLQRNEIFEHMSPEQKAGVRGASQAFHQMPQERQSQMRRAFQDLRGVPPQQRQSILNSARFQQQFSPQERTVLGNLLAVEPYQSQR